MKPCPYCPDRPKYTNEGLRVHIAKIHKDKLLLQPCPHPFCKKSLPADKMRAHWDEEHPTWLMHDGRYVWEVLDESHGVP